jgi:uncharacterized membrane protein
MENNSSPRYVGDRSSAVEGQPPVVGERRWPMALAVTAVTVLDALLPSAVRLGPRWLLGVVGVLLVAVIIADPGRIDKETRVNRALSISLLAILIASAAASTVLLIHDLITGGELTKSARKLLLAGNMVWLTNAVVFGLFYWQLDSGGSAARAHKTRSHPSLAFPQHMSPELAPPGWRPLFFDYLYLGFTCALTFGPCEVVPFENWAKATMLIESLLSLAVIGLVIARAVSAFP